MANAFDDIDEAETPTPPPAKGRGSSAPARNAFDDVDPADDKATVTLGPITAAPAARPEPEPEPVDERKFAAPASAIARASLATTPETQIIRYAEHFNQPVTDFKVRDGKVIRRVPETGAFALVEPSLFGGKGAADQMGRVMDFGASLAGPAIPAVTGAVGTIAGTAAGLPAGPVGAFAGGTGGGGAGGAAGDSARQWLDRFLASDEKTKADWDSIAEQGVWGAANTPVAKVAGWAGKLITKIPGAKPIIEGIFKKAEETGENLLGLSKEARDAVVEWIEKQKGVLDQAAQDAKDLGYNLSLGQKTRSETILAMERAHARTPEGMQPFATLRDTQNKVETPRAVRQTLDAISPKTSPEAAVAGFREGAEATTQKALADRGVIAKKAYADALDARTDRFWNEDIDKLMNRPSMERAIGYAKKIAAEEGKDLSVPVYENGKMVGRDVVPDWRSWDYIKQGVDAVIEENKNEFGKLNPYGRVVARTKDQLLGILDKANPEYKAARGAYGSASDTAEMILNGGVGLIRNMKGLDAEAMINRVLGGKIMPEEIARMRGQFASAGKIKEWDAAVRNYAEGALTDALNPTRRGVINNTAGALRVSLFDDPRQADVLKAAIGDPAKIERWEKLGRALESARHQLAEGSPTMTDAMLLKTPIQQVTGWARSLVAAKTGHGAIDMADRLAATQSPAARKKMVQYLLTDEGDRALRSLPIKITPHNQIRANAILGAILVNSGVGIGHAVTAGDDDGE